MDNNSLIQLGQYLVPLSSVQYIDQNCQVQEGSQTRTVFRVQFNSANAFGGQPWLDIRGQNAITARRMVTNLADGGQITVLLSGEGATQETTTQTATTPAAQTKSHHAGRPKTAAAGRS